MFAVIASDAGLQAPPQPGIVAQRTASGIRPSAYGGFGALGCSHPSAPIKGKRIPFIRKLACPLGVAFGSRFYVTEGQKRDTICVVRVRRASSAELCTSLTSARKRGVLGGIGVSSDHTRHVYALIPDGYTQLRSGRHSANVSNNFVSVRLPRTGSIVFTGPEKRSIRYRSSIRQSTRA